MERGEREGGRQRKLWSCRIFAACSLNKLKTILKFKMHDGVWSLHHTCMPCWSHGETRAHDSPGGFYLMVLLANIKSI